VRVRVRERLEKLVHHAVIPVLHRGGEHLLYPGKEGDVVDFVELLGRQSVGERRGRKGGGL